MLNGHLFIVRKPANQISTGIFFADQFHSHKKSNSFSVQKVTENIQGIIPGKKVRNEQERPTPADPSPTGDLPGFQIGEQRAVSLLNARSA